MADVIPAPDAVKPEPTKQPENPAAEQSDTTTAADEAAGSQEQPAATDDSQKQDKPEPTPAELARKERNRQRWAQMKQERTEALQRAAWAEAELARIRNSRPDFSEIQDPDEALALRTAQKVREMSAGEHEARVAQERARADGALFEAWNATKEEMRARVPDFDQVVTDQTPIHRLAAPFIVESERGGEIAYWLGKNPDAARDLYQKFETAPAQALVELGRIEARVSAPASKAVTKAPKPAPTLAGMASPPGFDVSSASVSDMAAELKKAGIIR